MATIEVRGYVQKPQAKKSKAGKEFVQFGLGSKQKGKNGEPDTWANFSVTDFSTGSPLPPKSYVEVKGYLKVREYNTADGRKGQSLDIVAQSVEDMSTPREGGETAQPAADKGYPDEFDDIK